jgi:hypothetical protein
MKDRFDLESKIAFTGTFAEHLRDLAHNVLENDLSKDEIANALEGLAILIDSHERVLFDTFTQALQLDAYNESNR